MKESEIQRMSVAQIIKKIGLTMEMDDFERISIDIDPEEIKRLKNILATLPQEELAAFCRKFLIDHDKNIDKTALVMVILKNWEQDLAKGDVEDIVTAKRVISKAKEILKGTNKQIYTYIRQENGRLYINVLDSQEQVTGRKKVKNRKKLELLEEQNVEIQDILETLFLTDIFNVIFTGKFKDTANYQWVYNLSLDKGVVLDYITQSQIDMLSDQITYEDVMPEVESIIRNNIEYIDLDKLLLCSAYRQIEYLERNLDSVIGRVTTEEIHRRLKVIQEVLKGSNVRIDDNLENPKYNKGKKEGTEEIEYSYVFYKLGDLKKDMQKFEGATYWGEAKIEQTKLRLFLGEILLDNAIIQRINLNKNERCLLAMESDENYLYLLNNNMLDLQSISNINSERKTFSNECLDKLLEMGILDKSDLMSLYLQGKTNKEYIINLGIEPTIQEMFSQMNSEDISEERMLRLGILYLSILSGKSDEELRANKEAIFDAYFEEFNPKYLETFIALGALTFDDIRGLMPGEKWIEAMENEEISKDFFIDLQKERINYK